MSRDDSKARLWAARLDRFRRSGLSLAQFCRQEDFPIAAFYYWRKKINSNCATLPEPNVSERQLNLQSKLLRFTIEARGVKIECQSESLQTLDAVLAWAMRQQDSVFQQLIVRD
jgi:hypothetical protein